MDDGERCTMPAHAEALSLYSEFQKVEIVLSDSKVEAYVVWQIDKFQHTYGIRSVLSAHIEYIYVLYDNLTSWQTYQLRINKNMWNQNGSAVSLENFVLGLTKYLSLNFKKKMG